MAILDDFESGKAAPASIIRNYGSYYIWIKAGGNITYIQNKYPRGRGWKVVDDIVSDVSLGNSLFVSSAGKTVANGAIRESLTNHFSNLEEARDAALAGDTIYVRGDHTVTSNLAVDNVGYWFLGRPTITYNSGVAYSYMWGDGGVDMTINVKGDAIFLSPTTDRQVIDISGANTNYNIDCYQIIGAGGIVVFIQGGTDESAIKVENKIDNTVNGNNIRLGGNAKGSIICPLMTNTATVGSRSTLFLRAFTGNFKIVGDLKNDSFDGTQAPMTVAISDGGTGTINIIGDVYAEPNVDIGTFGTTAAILIDAGSYKVNLTGDVYGYYKHCFEISSVGGTNDCVLTHVGNQINTDVRPCVLISSQDSPNSSFNGIIQSTFATSVIKTTQLRGILRVAGSVISSLDDIGQPAAVGIDLSDSANYEVILRSLDIQVKQPKATPYGISAPSNKDIKVFDVVGSNVGYNNITNLIVGTIFITDSNYLTF